VKLLVTGKHGQIARSLAERAGNHPELAIRFAGRPEVDLTVPGSLADAVEANRPDVVINAAAYTDVDKAESEAELARRVNADAAGEAAAAAASVGAAIIQISTDYVFDGRSDRPYREDDPVNPINVYGASKAAGEEQVRSANPRHLILRTSWVVSPFGRNFVKTMVRAARSRDQLSVVNDQRGRPTSALDLADAILCIAGAWDGEGGTYHLAGGGDASWFELATAVMEECRRRGAPAAEVRPIASADWPTAAKRPPNSVLDCSKVADELGIRLPAWRQSVDSIVQRVVGGDD
jgi:dTDP-4-dehydrorhamnose reductase